MNIINAMNAININIGDLAVPLIFAVVCLAALIKRVDLFGEFCAGVKDGLETVRDIFPSLFALVVSVGMFRSCGAVDAIAGVFSPLTSLAGFPQECVPLLIMRPFSGSGAVALFEQLLAENGADSMAGRVASVMLGSSETTFYTIAVYFSSTRVKNMRYVLAAALTGDLTGWFFSTLAVNLLLK